MNNKDIDYQTMYKSAIHLKNVTTQVTNNQLEVVYRGTPLDVEFRWNEPTKRSDLAELQGNYGYHLPIDYALFLMEISNGATLYYEIQYRQSGFKLYNVEEMAGKQKE